MYKLTNRGGRIRLAGLFLLLVAGVSAHAVQLPAPEGKGAAPNMLDARVNLQDSFARALAARPGARESGQAAANAQAIGVGRAIAQRRPFTPALEIRLSQLTGGVTSIHNNAGALTTAAPGVPSETIVRDYLARNGDLFGLGGADINDLVVLGDSPGGASGLRMLRVEQQIDGRPIFQSETRFTLDREGRIVKAVGMLVPSARARTPAIDSARILAPGAAVSRLMSTLGHAVAPAGITIVADDGLGRLELAATDPLINGPMTARQVLFPLAPGVLVPAWSLVVFTSGRQDWYAIVDAETGDLLWRKNIRTYASTHPARFRVYVQADGVTPADSPSPLSPTTAVPGVQPPGIAPSIVSMQVTQDIVASPNGWINDCPGGVCTANETQTLGNNVLVCLDRISSPTTPADNNICDTAADSVLDGNGRPTGNPDVNGRNRDFLGTVPRDFQTGYLPPPQGGNPEAGQTATGTGLPLDSFRRGAATQLFYISNWYHDKLYRLGFDEASANFQQTNFSGMGAGGDRVLADLQDGSGTNNANFATPPDGTSGRMQMYRFTGPTIDRDASLDAEIVIHELAHGTSNRLVGNAAGLNWDPASSMGEGWSDFYALSLLNNTNADNPNAPYASGGYATYKLGGLLDNYTYGIRRFPYSTNNAVNPLTWGDVDDVTNNLSGGIAPSSLNFNDNGGMEVHNAGELWALTLWEVRARVIGDPAGANGDVPTGNQTMLQLVTDALKMTPINPGFTDGRNAILQADCATNSCANEASIWGGFADRGLGYNAKTPYNIMFGYTAAHMGVKESFQSPYLDVVNPVTDVTVTGGNNNGQADPGESVSMVVKLTNPWRASSKAVASVSATLTTSTPGVTISTNTSTYGAIAPQGTATGTAFVVNVAASVPCGATIDFTLTTVSSLGTTATTFSIRTGGASGTDPAITYTNVVPGGLAIPDGRPRAVFTQATITDDFEIADLNFRVDNLTHTWTGDLTVALRSPGAIGSDIISLIGGLVGGGGQGDNMINMVIDDQVAVSAANDMVQAPNSAAPYTKSWLPVFNAPWSALAGFGPPDLVGSLSRYNGTSTKGTWAVMVSDQFGGDVGTLNSWSMIVTPRRFVCAGPPVAASRYPDFNDDGKSDLSWKNTSTGATSLWLMNGTTFSSFSTVLADPNWSVTQRGDLNGDGMTDLVWRSLAGQTVVWLQNGLAPTGSATLLSDPNWAVQRVADLSGDGKVDLLWRNSSTGQNAAWLMNGLTPTSSAILFGDPNWLITHTGDFNGDGRKDLVWRNTSTGATAIWLMNGLTPTSAGTIFTSLNWTVTHVGDFNGDGMDDLVWRSGTGQTAVWLMNGLTPSSSATIFTSVPWAVTHVGDFDGDGKDDLAWRNNSTGQTAVWLMNGTATASSAVVLTDVNWAVTHIGDTNGDGKSDLLWRNTSTGATVVWLMNGLTFSVFATLLTDPSWALSPPDGL